MFDAYGRNIHYLRLSVTDLCNLRCRYCMPDGVPKLAHEDILTYEEFLRLAALFAQCGIDTVRITGGEPLVRRGVEQLTAGLKAIPGIRRVALTTNGVLLAQKLPALLAAGLDSVNISLDTLYPETFRRITGKDELAAVQNGIRAALASGIPVKLNCVPQPGVNEGELESLAAHGATMVIFLSIGLVDKVQQALLAGGAYTPDTPAAVVYKATWPEEKTVRCTVGTLAESVHAAGITKTALIVAGGFLGRNYERSKLYDPAFTTEFRKGTDQ